VLPVKCQRAAVEWTLKRVVVELVTTISTCKHEDNTGSCSSRVKLRLPVSSSSLRVLFFRSFDSY